MNLATVRLRLRERLWLLLPLSAGVVLRFFGIWRQVAAGDELHAVRAALTMPVPKILVTYLPTDHCIPLTAFYRCLLDLGLKLDEMLLRLPVLVSALLVLGLLPAWVDKRFGRPVAWPFAWLLAVSPTLVYYSRIVRSYTPIVLLASLAAIAFVRWYRRPSRWNGAAYVAAAALAAYFHPGATPFVLSPFAFLAAMAALGRGPSRWRQGAALAAATAAGLAAFIVPAWPSLRQLIAAKRQPAELSWQTWEGVLSLQSGTSIGALTALFWTLAVLGLIRLWVQKPVWGFYASTLAAGQVSGIVILSPLAMHQANIMNRYLLVALPLVLLWVAMALAWLSRPLAKVPPGRWIALAGMALVYFFAGPLPDPELRSGPFAHQAEWTKFYLQRRSPAVSAPEPYSRLDPRQGGALAEYPWHPMWMYNGIFRRYATAHGREVLVIPGEKLLWDERLRFRNMVPPDPERILATRAVYLVVHLDSRREDAGFDRPLRASPAADRAMRLRARRDRQLGRLDRQAAAKAAEWTDLWGPADIATADFRIWDLQRIRDREGGGSAP